MGFIKQVFQDLNNEFATIAVDGIIGDIDGYLDTGSYILNALISGSIYGGIPTGKVTALAGAHGVGKTYFCLDIMKHFLNNDPKAEVILFESESALTSDILKERGIDTKRVLNIPVETVEQFRTECVQLIKRYGELEEKHRTPILFILDSLGNLSTLKEMGDVEDGKNVVDMTRAKVIKGTFRVLTLLLGKAQIPMVITNHTYKQIGVMFPQDLMGGGSGIAYAASTIIFLSKKKDKEKTKTGGTKTIGNIIHARNYKNRLAREELKVDVKLNFNTGLDPYAGLVDFGVECGLLQKVSSKVKWFDGKNHFQKRIEQNPEIFFTEEVLEKFEGAAQAYFQYSNAGCDVEKDEKED